MSNDDYMRTRPHPEYSVVLEMVEQYMNEEAQGGSEGIWQIRWALSKKLPGSMDQRPNYLGQLTDRFCGQVYRACQHLAKIGKLVRPPNASGNDIVYYTPAAWEKHEDEAAERAARSADYKRRWDTASQSMADYGIDIGKPTLEHWERLSRFLDELPAAYRSCLVREGLGARPAAAGGLPVNPEATTSDDPDAVVLICKACEDSPDGQCEKHRK